MQKKRRAAAPFFKIPPPFNPRTGEQAPIGETYGKSRIAMFQVIEEDTHDNYLVCRGFDPEVGRFFHTINVAKPYGLRGTFNHVVGEVFPAAKPRTVLGDNSGVATATTGQPADLDEVVEMLLDDAGKPISWIELAKTDIKAALLIRGQATADVSADDETFTIDYVEIMAPDGGVIIDQNPPATVTDTMTIYNRPGQIAAEDDEIIAEWNQTTDHWERRESQNIPCAVQFSMSGQCWCLSDNVKSYTFTPTKAATGIIYANLTATDLGALGIEILTVSNYGDPCLKITKAGLYKFTLCGQISGQLASSVPFGSETTSAAGDPTHTHNYLYPDLISWPKVRAGVSLSAQIGGIGTYQTIYPGIVFSIRFFYSGGTTEGSVSTSGMKNLDVDSLIKISAAAINTDTADADVTVQTDFYLIVERIGDKTN